MIEISKVSVVGANENLLPEDILDFILTYPFAEVGIGVSAEKGGYNTARFLFIKKIQELVYRRCFSRRYSCGTIGLHVNGNGKDGEKGWSYQVLNGIVPPALFEMMSFPRMSMQVNHYGYDIPPQNARHLANSRGLWDKIAPLARLILSYSKRTEDYVRNFNRFLPVRYDRTLNWDVLLDASFGQGIMNKEYVPPLCTYIHQGYAGGYSANNILAELAKIYAVIQHDISNTRHLPARHPIKIWPDAESKLKTDDGKTLDLVKAGAFYKEIMYFQNQFKEIKYSSHSK